MKSFSETREHLLALTFFNDFEARTVEAICERIIPGGDGDAGATEAGVVYYIDLALAGFSISLQNVYRLGLRELELDCRRLYGTSFVDLDLDRQDDVVREFLGPEVSTAAGTRSKSEFDTSDRHLLDRLFAVVREHAIEGRIRDLSTVETATLSVGVLSAFQAYTGVIRPSR